MSEIAAAARLTLAVADFANVDQLGKVNLVGGNVGLLGYDHMQGITSRFSVWAHVALPHRLIPAEFALELALLDDGDAVYEISGPMGSQAVRMAEAVRMDRSNAPVISALRDHVGGFHQMVVDFNAGLPLKPNTAYVWRLQIDGDDQHEVRYPFGVTGPLPGPVIG